MTEKTVQSNASLWFIMNPMVLDSYLAANGRMAGGATAPSPIGCRHRLRRGQTFIQGFAMRARFDGSDTGLRAAAGYLDTLDASEDFWAAIANHDAFDFATITSAQVAQRIRDCENVMEVRLWTPSPARALGYRNTVAVTDPDQPFVLFYHTKFLRNSIGRKVNTIVHEFVHNVDNNDDDPGEQMGHGDNDWRDKQNSAPYWIGNHAQTTYEQQADGEAGKNAEPPLEFGVTRVESDEIVDEEGGV